MSRFAYLELAAQQHRMPIGVDLVLRRHADADAILRDGRRLGELIAEAAASFETPLAFPLMDLTLEKARLLPFFGISPEVADMFHFTTAPGPEAVARFEHELPLAPPPPRVAASLGALRHIATKTAFVPIGMSIGPFSLASKLLVDPITPVYLAGSGISAADEPEVALVETALRIALFTVLHSIREQLDAGANAIFIAEPAANKIFFSPNQIADGSDVFDRFVLAPNRAIARLLEQRHADLLFHCCGDLIDEMLDGFCSLHPVLLSLGSSRCLWEDAARVPDDIVLYGNLPSKQFYSDRLMPAERVAAMAEELSRRMQATGHPFILGTECDTLHVDGCAETIRAKVAQLLRVPADREKQQAVRVAARHDMQTAP